MAATAEGVREKRIAVGKQCDAVGHPKVFTLTFGGETLTLDPGKSWIKVDAFKWTTRGLIEEPQSFHVLADATVEINGEKIGLHDPDAIAKLEHEINKRHIASAARPPHAALPSARPVSTPGQTPGSNRFNSK